VVVVVVVSGEEAQPETRTVARARAAKAISLFFIAINSHGEEKLDASKFRIIQLPGFHSGVNSGKKRKTSGPNATAPKSSHDVPANMEWER
jgi:hypothetical protein